MVCDQVPLDDVQKVFKRTSFPRLASVKLTLQPYTLEETVILADIFGTKRILDIWIQYPLGVLVNRSLRLQVDVNAFRSTQNYTNKFTIDAIDCTLMDLGFLSGFDKLAHFSFWNIDNIQHCLPSLPNTLPRLTKLYFKHCSGLNELDTFPTLTNGLEDA